MSSKEDTLRELYHYLPSKPAAIIFAILYIASSFLHEYQYKATRPQKFTMPFVLGTTFSSIGFVTRSLSALKIGDPRTLWRISTMFTIGAGPTYAGADYFVCGRIFSYVRYAAPISPLRTVRTFIFFDFLAEIGVWVGAGINDSKDPNSARAKLGVNLVRAAVIIQLALFACFVAVVLLFQIRATSRGFWRASHQQSGGTPGWVKVIYTLSTEAPFLCLEALVMFINAAMFNVIHPGVLLPSNPHVYLLADGMEAEDDSPEGTLEDTRPLKMKILDPLDIKGLFRKKQQLKPYQQRPLGGDDENMSESMIMLENRQREEFR
ncbi:RTA1 domain protein, putative [Trichophyton verrucosum HKI 0517]|uniref:RTA1 domain protein, putative n=1 Tax=Trichophyton verrucosum (strain HKI 0517) TaxID=663202 RepID=D4D103_TRIVH|nr:RTA1 domain protein, putative [Trichophyton verrucosum HKI 0517]EFE44480.1 RTA1 domain protein, putative [Trichophyton verrucosum HKI 0517]